MAGVAYEVDPELAGETVVVWWGLFDQELFVEHGENRYGPYDPIGGPVPLHRYRRHRKSRREARAERVDALAAEIGLPRAALSGNPDLVSAGRREPPASRPFVDPDPFRTLTFANVVAAKLAIDQTTVETVLSRRLDDLEPQLTRHGYDLRSLCEQFDARPTQIRQLLRGDLDPARTNELSDQMRAAGLPV